MFLMRGKNILIRISYSVDVIDKCVLTPSLPDPLLRISDRCLLSYNHDDSNELSFPVPVFFSSPQESDRVPEMSIMILLFSLCQLIRWVL